MSHAAHCDRSPAPDANWVRLIAEFGPRFARRAGEHDASDSFVFENFSELKASGLLAAGIPAELGGGDIGHQELCEMLRILARHCGSTALAFSMHTHLVATLTWRWHRERTDFLDDLLRRIVDEQLVLISTGASDWLEGSGTVERVENGWLVNGRKRFCSGVPIGDYLLTGAVHDDLANGPTILHFPLSLKAKGVHILSTWQTLGMRGTGSHDVVIERVFVPDADIMAYRPQGKWHPVIHTSVLVGLPLIFSVYLGIAEAARDIAIKYASSRSDKIGLCCLVGEMENELAAARVAHADMVLATAALEPSEAATNRVFIGRTLVGRAAMRTVEKAMEVTGGKAFHRDTGLERLFRDVQAGRYHSPQEKPQQHYSGQVALLLNTYDD